MAGVVLSSQFSRGVNLAAGRRHKLPSRQPVPTRPKAQAPQAELSIRSSADTRARDQEWLASHAESARDMFFRWEQTYNFPSQSPRFLLVLLVDAVFDLVLNTSAF